MEEQMEELKKKVEKLEREVAYLKIAIKKLNRGR